MKKNLKIYRSSAGSGKTYSLVRNFISMALGKAEESFNPRYFRHILAITFTNKAASEMKERVLALMSDLSNGLGRDNEHSFFSHILQDTQLTKDEIILRSQAVLSAILHHYSDLSISTIDKFVFRIVKTFAHDLQMSQAFEVEMDQDLLIQPSVSFLISRIGTNKELSDALVSFALSNADEGKSYNLETSLEQFSSHLFAEKSEKYIRSLSTVSIADCLEVKDNLQNEITAFEEFLLEKRRIFLEFCHKNNIEATDFTSSSYYNYFDRFRLRSAKHIYPSPTLKKNVDNSNWYAQRLPQDKKDILDENTPFLKSIFEEVQDFIHKGFKKYIFNKLLYKNIYSIAVLNELSKEMERFKEEHNVKHISEFNHAIAEVIRSEPSPFIYERLGERYHHFLIDEFQDTSVIQWHNLLPLIHNSLSEGNQNMIVGDAKQSIYRWRGGEVEQFVQIPNRLFKAELLPNPEELSLNIKRNAKEYFLSENWRSDQEIVKFNNAFFSKLKDVISPELKDIYDSVEQNPMGPEGGYIHIDLTPKSSDFKSEVMNKIILQIQELQSLNYQWSDMAILCRTGKETYQAAKSLTQAGIAVISDEALLLNSSKEVEFLCSLLSYMYNPLDKIAQTFMVSYLYYREPNERYSLHQCLVSIGKGDSNTFFDFLKTIKIDFNPYLLWDLPIYDLVERLIFIFRMSSKDIYLQYFLDTVHKFSIKNSNDVSSFLEWWGKNNHKEAIVVPQDTNAVKVMTVHKSKGLEFPIVFIPFNWAMGKPNKEVWVDAKGNIKKMKVALLSNSKQLEHSEYAEIHHNENHKALMDDLNVLYVAMTRPVNQLYIYTEAYNKLDKFNSLSKMIGYYFSPSIVDFPVKIGRLKAKEHFETKKNNEYHVDYTSLNDWRKVIRLKDNSNILWDVQHDRQQWGSLLHQCLASIHQIEDKDKVLDQLHRNGLIGKELKAKLRLRIEELLNDDQILTFFEKGWEIKTEQEILQKSGQTYIPDRVMIKENEIKIVDYKTGSMLRLEQHKKQVDEYCKVLNMMGFEKITKYIVYTEECEKIVTW